MTRPQPRLPLADVWAAFPAIAHAVDPICGHPARNTALARASGVSPRQIYRWIRDDLTLTAAENLADALGVHPTHIWPDYWAACETAAA